MFLTLAYDRRLCRNVLRYCWRDDIIFLSLSRSSTAANIVQIAMKSCTDIHGPQRTKFRNFGDLHFSTVSIYPKTLLCFIAVSMAVNEICMMGHIFHCL